MSNQRHFSKWLPDCELHDAGTHWTFLIRWCKALAIRNQRWKLWMKLLCAWIGMVKYPAEGHGQNLLEGPDTQTSADRERE